MQRAMCKLAIVCNVQQFSAWLVEKLVESSWTMHYAVQQGAICNMLCANFIVCNVQQYSGWLVEKLNQELLSAAKVSLKVKPHPELYKSKFLG